MRLVVLLATLSSIGTIGASYCGQAAVPYSLQALTNGQPVLGCARPSCFGWTANGRRAADTAQFYRIDKHEDGFLRPNDGKNRPRNSPDGFQAQVSQCDSGFKSIECKGDSWVGGIGPQAVPQTNSLKLVCCHYEKLIDSVEVGIAIVSQGQIVTGGEVLRNGRQYAFDYISNIQKAVNEVGNITYTVHIRRFNCLPHFDTRPVKVDERTQQYIMEKFVEKPQTKSYGPNRSTDSKDDSFRRAPPFGAVHRNVKNKFSRAAFGSKTLAVETRLQTDGTAKLTPRFADTPPIQSRTPSQFPTRLQGVEQAQYPPALPPPSQPQYQPRPLPPQQPNYQVVQPQQPSYQSQQQQQQQVVYQQQQQQQQPGADQSLLGLDLRPLQNLLGIQTPQQQPQQQPTVTQYQTPAGLFVQPQQQPQQAYYINQQDSTYPAPTQQQQQPTLGGGTSFTDSVNQALGQIQQMIFPGQQQQQGQAVQQQPIVQQQFQPLPQATYQQQAQPNTFGQPQPLAVSYPGSQQQGGIAYGQTQRESAPLVFQSPGPQVSRLAEGDKVANRHVDSRPVRLQQTTVPDQTQNRIHGGQPAIYVEPVPQQPAVYQQPQFYQQQGQLPQTNTDQSGGAQPIFEYANNLLRSVFGSR